MGRSTIFLILAGTLLLGCRREEAPAASMPPGLEVGATVLDIRSIDPEPRLSRINGVVREVRWPWVLVASSPGNDAATFWVNFSHVCSFRVETPK
jgi:hypothetical protein